MTTIPPSRNLLQRSASVGHGEVKEPKRIRTGSVTFADISLQHEIPHINDHTEEERRGIWWGADDLVCFQLKCAITVRQMEILGNEFKESERKCSQGLEPFTTAGDRLRKKRRRDAAQAVLQEQTRQWAHAIHAPELIAQSYQDVSRPSQRDAHVAALREKQHADRPRHFSSE